MVKVGKLWGDARFASLSSISKLLYCYLTSHQSISTLGVIELNLGNATAQVDVDLDVYYESARELEQKNFVSFIERDRGSWETVVVHDHFKTLPKSKANIRKAIDEAKRADEDLQHVFRGLFTGADFEGKESFKPPTPQEVTEYGLSLGYLISGRDFVNYYGDNDWYDKNDKKVRNWKSKLRKVWCRETNKLQTAKGAPKGYEHFFVETDDGDRIFPESWKDGLPSHSNYIYAQYLIEEFNGKTNS